MNNFIEYLVIPVLFYYQMYILLSDAISIKIFNCNLEN